MSKIKIILSEYFELKVEQGTGVNKILMDLAPESEFKRNKNYIAAEYNGKLIDLSAPLHSDGHLKFIEAESEVGLKIVRHSCAHLLAHVVQDLYPKVHFGIGPDIENGFYYDFQIEKPFSSEDLELIEEKVAELINKNIFFERSKWSKLKALEYFKNQGELLKVELLEEMPDDNVSIYKSGDFLDLCKGPHLPSSKYIKAFKLISTAGAYWRGNEKRPMLQRIYGVAFNSQEELQEHLQKIEEAKQRDHRKLGRELDIFSIFEEAGAGLVYWHPNGAILKEIIESFWKKVHWRWGYQLVSIPHIALSELWKQSGHLHFYKENMYTLEVDGTGYVLKPMNCPGHFLIYKNKLHSYRELPIRYAELGTVYRYERSGTLHGVMRVRGFTQDDAHIFCTPEQMVDELAGVLDLTEYLLSSFGFTDYQVELSVRDPALKENYAGSDPDWEHAEAGLVEALKRRNWSYTRKEGEAVFYGPKIDIKIIDALGNPWQCTTVQFDFIQPHNFDITYIGADGQAHKVLMIHRAILGALERFIGILIEHYKGSFPFWLAPVQAVVLPIADRHHKYAAEWSEKLQNKNYRIKLDLRNEKIGYKIRENQQHKIPYMLIIGDREVENKTVALRDRQEGDLGSFNFEKICEKWDTFSYPILRGPKNND